MNKTLAIALLLGAAIACDPWVDDCTPQEDLPRRFIGAYWMHGIVSYIQSIYQFIVFSAYVSSLTLFSGDTFLVASYGIAAANFLGYFPVALIWTLSVVWDDVSMYKRYFGWLKASNIYGWLLTVTNLTWYGVLILYIFVFGAFSGAKPSFILPIAASSIELILQILYSIGYGKSRKLMYCWYYEMQTKGYCDWVFEEDSNGSALFDVTISV